MGARRRSPPETAMSLVPLGEHMLRGIVAPCAVVTLPAAAGRRQDIAGWDRSGESNGNHFGALAPPIGSGARPSWLDAPPNNL